MNEYLGHDSLRDTANKHNFNNWLYEQVFSALKGDILEIGSGTGIYSEKIIHDFPKSMITLSDVSLSYVSDLSKKYDKNNVHVHKLDLNSKEDYEKIGYEKFDSIVGINVLDNVENDVFALQHLYHMLRKDGVLAIIVPSYGFLYNTLDTNIGRLRRYSKSELELKIKNTDFKIIRMYHFNLLGMIGWYINGKLGKNPTLSDTAFGILDRMISTSKFIESMTGNKIGLSIVCHLQK